MRNHRRREAGFTLMELMVVIVIVAILAAVAVPLYINYVQDAQRTEAKGAIGAVITAQQVYYQKNGGTGYTNNLDDLNVDLSDVDSKWTITIPGSGPDNFTIRAEPVGASVDSALIVTYTYDRSSGQAEWNR